MKLVFILSPALLAAVKVLFLITSEGERMEMGIKTAYRSVVNGTYEDPKVIFYGLSQLYLTKIEGELLQTLKELISKNAVDFACVGVARRNGIESKLTSLGLRLEPFSVRLAYYVNQGYVVVSF
ncbi:hypothetical protein HS1genome_0526 [Sulfodiicoccus acidiphilus]|uniref:DsrE family protein n=1 Tax=Sulfodiicoccus acidiphilus TaxID=1670455 RepID=A0A348B1T5_9CREN|nr:hypothetical protein [Sulfodiicoccus acidiphilus]BBD72137.1 hypothetical protein HS1genome_0526 [Sulfodiicoccus acidiphilus]GGT94710.1 hypothetical protein GCM10007116_10390 [Sulfodiicoccus acidiphilus]